MPVPTIEWKGGVEGHVELIDQTLLPTEYKIIRIERVEDMWEAIKSLRVRGAPAIGVAGAMGVALAARNCREEEQIVAAVGKAAEYLATSRPTAVNLFWALDRMKRVARESANLSAAEAKQRLLAEAKAILEEDRAMCRAIGRHGARLVEDGDGVLTHCNAGGLATGDYGTALACMFAAHEQGKRIHVYADETRPLLQGARLTVWELMQAGVAVTLICDNTAAQMMKEERVQRVIVGADRIAANGDTANKIGTYGVAVLARAHGVPFFVAAPTSTFDLSLPDGSRIPIEERGAEEVTNGFGRRTAPEGAAVYCPAFDVTPASLVTAIVTERGVIEAPTRERIAQVVAAPNPA